MPHPSVDLRPGPPTLAYWLPMVLVLACATGQQVPTPSAAPASAARLPDSSGGPPLVPFQGRGGFTVLMPPRPDQSERTENTRSGPVYVDLIQAGDEMAKYLASVSEFPKGSLDQARTKDLLDSLQTSTIQSMHGTVASSHDVEASGMPGREFTATDPQGSEVTARIFIGGSSVYTLAGTYPRGDIPAPIRRFLDSFQPPAATALNGAAGTKTVKSSAR